jgi:predicted transposase YdaD
MSFLAGLRLEITMIARIIRRDVMRESVTYQAILDEGREEGREAMVINLLREGVAIAVIAKASGLSIEQVAQLQREQSP